MVNAVTEKERGWYINLKVNGSFKSFKIDTGASVTAIPYDDVTATWILEPTVRQLKGAGGHDLSTMGTRVCTLTNGAKTTSESIFVVKGLVEPLLGQVAIKRLDLLYFVQSITTSTQWKSLFPQLFTGLGCMKNQCSISVREDVEPVAVSAPRRVAAARIEPLRKELNRMEKLGVISKVEEPLSWCSPCLVVPKKNGDIRLCIDYTRLNEAVRRAYHPLPVTEEVLSKLGNAKVFTKLDANSGYWQMELDPTCRHLTCFITPFGRYICNRLPFGINLAPEVFQREMSKILEGLEGVVCQMDDVLVFASTKQDHDAILTEVLSRMSKAGLTLNSEKCAFEQEEVTFLGHIVNKEGIRADPDKVKAIVNYPSPKTKKELRRFMGVVNYLGKFTAELSRCTVAMRELLKKSVAWLWGPQHEEEFQRVKRLMVTTPILVPFDMNAQTRLSTDASSYGLGAALMQKSDDSWRPVAYASRAMSETERRYAQVEKEALAICWAADKFHFYLAGRQFQVETDHKPLVSILGTKELCRLPLRVQRFRLKMMAYSFDIFHTPGDKLVLADMLSRNEQEKSVDGWGKLEDPLLAEIFSSLPVSGPKLERIRGCTAAEEEGQLLLRFCNLGWPPRDRLPDNMENFYSVRHLLTLMDGVIFFKNRIYVPGTERASALNDIHSGHQGEVKCIRRAAELVWWPGMSKDIRDVVRNCATCAEHRLIPKEPLCSTPFPLRPWWRLGADLCEFNGRHFLVLIDYYSRYIVAEELVDTLAATVVARLHTVFCLFGVPHTIVTDNGSQFVSDEYRSFLIKWDIVRVTSAPRQAQSNGEAERAVRTVKGLLEKNVDFKAALLCYRDTPLSNGYSPAQLLFGRSLNSMGVCSQRSVDLRKLKETESESSAKQARQYNRRHRVQTREELPINQPVVIRDPGGERRGEVVTASGREVAVQVENGNILRRNRAVVAPAAPVASQQTRAVIAPTAPAASPQTLSGEPPIATSGNGKRHAVTRQYDGQERQTRSGRAVYAPTRLDL